MSPACSFQASMTLSFPRVSGDEPTFSVYTYAAFAFSPRERG